MHEGGGGGGGGEGRVKFLLEVTLVSWMLTRYMYLYNIMYNVDFFFVQCRSF